MAITEEARAALDGIGDVDWSAFSHPYGRAEDVPLRLRGALSAPETDDAYEAGIFFRAYFVCQGVHFGDAVVPAIPFLLRLVSVPGVSRRGALLGSLVDIVGISVRSVSGEIDEALKRECLQTFAAQSKAILDTAQFLDGHGFDDAIEVLVVAFADTVGALASAVPTTEQVREVLREVGVVRSGASPGDRLAAWAARQSVDLGKRLSEIQEALPEEWDPSEGEDDD